MIKIEARQLTPVKHPTFDYEGPDILAFVSEKPGRHINTGKVENLKKRPWKTLLDPSKVVMSNGDLDWSNENTWNAMLDRSVVYF